MSNLIITIISLVIIAVVAAMGIYYGGQAYQSAQINAIANSIMNEAQQILAAERIWSTNAGQPDISGMGIAGASGTGMSMLVSSKSLAEWPSFAGTMGVSYSLTNPGPQPWTGTPNATATISTGTYDKGCYSINGWMGVMRRFMFAYNNGNYVAYMLYTNYPYTPPCNSFNGAWNSGTPINNPIVQIAQAINASMRQIPSNIQPWITNLPAAPVGSTAPTNVYDTSNGGAAGLYVDPNGVLQTNYCWMAGNIVCVFGPS